jgi:hypothetical protein
VVPLQFEEWPLLVLGTALGASWLFPGRQKAGAAMLELVALVTAAALIPVIVVLGLFRLAGLKRVEDLRTPDDEWARSQDRNLK